MQIECDLYPFQHFHQGTSSCHAGEQLLTQHLLQYYDALSLPIDVQLNHGRCLLILLPSLLQFVFDKTDESSGILATEDICFICVPFVLFNDTEESSERFKTEMSFQTTDEAEEIEEADDDKHDE